VGKIITLGHKKGGVGKSTLSVNIADCISSYGLSVALVDVDPQRSCAKARALFGKGREYRFDVLDLSDQPGTLHQALPKLDYQFVVVDCPPASDVLAMSSALRVTDLLIIPFKPFPFDFLEFREMEPLVDAARKINPKLKHVGVATQVPARPTKLNVEVIEAARATNMHVLESLIHQRDAYPAATAEARGVVSSKLTTKSDKAALSEVEALVDEIIRLLS